MAKGICTKLSDRIFKTKHACIIYLRFFFFIIFLENYFLLLLFLIIIIFIFGLFAILLISFKKNIFWVTYFSVKTKYAFCIVLYIIFSFQKFWKKFLQLTFIKFRSLLLLSIICFFFEILSSLFKCVCSLLLIQQHLVPRPYIIF